MLPFPVLSSRDASVDGRVADWATVDITAVSKIARTGAKRAKPRRLIMLRLGEARCIPPPIWLEMPTLRQQTPTSLASSRRILQFFVFITNLVDTSPIY